jgi:uncharacterized phage protein gp47/JayE
MAFSSSVPPIVFSEAGLILPTDAAILAGVLTDIDAAFGGGLNFDLETPQGQLASSISAIISQKNTEIAYLVNQIDPQYSEDRFQDSIGRIYFLARKPALSTKVTATLTGVAGAIIPAGSLAQDTSGYTYTLDENVTIDSSGTVEAVFSNTETGAIPCPAGSLSIVYQAITGWDAVTNNDDGIEGNAVESRADFERRRSASVSINAAGTLPSIFGEVANVDGVTDVYVTENNKDITITKGITNYTLLPHSVYVATVGGDSQDIGEAIWRKKNVGCNTNGDVLITVYDYSVSDVSPPSYLIRFIIASPVSIKFAVQISYNNNLPDNITNLVRNAIISKFNGNENMPKETIGSTIFASSYYQAVNAISPSVAALSILVGSQFASQSSIEMGIDEYPTLIGNNIAVSLV